MCGFLGVFGRSYSSLNELKERKIAESLSHRGPDDFEAIAGVSYLVMFWRLSIVDRQGGKQPMISGDQKKTILFNGEIYNYKEIRRILTRDGVSFRTDSDTEVAMAAYEKWGISCFDRFEGMFAICIIDEDKNEIILVRDRLGVKPLYFKNRPGDLMVASEQKAIMAILPEPPKLDKISFSSYLVFQTILGTRTLFEGISKVPPGTVLRFNLQMQQLIGVSKLQSRISTLAVNSYSEYRSLIRERILEQTALTLDTDLPICFHLSGGIDSNTLIALCRFLDPSRSFACVSSVVEGIRDPELKYIQQSAEYHNCKLKLADISEKSFFEVLDDVIYYLDEPVGDPGVVAQFLVNKLASEESKIVFAGQGFDEMFFGYTRNLAAYVMATYGVGALNASDPVFKSLNKNITGFFEGWEKFIGSMTAIPGLTPELAYFMKLCRHNPFEQMAGLNEDFRKPLYSVALDTFHDFSGQNISLHDFMFEVETKIQLPSLLHMEDRASMRYSLETRVPFCTAGIVDLARLSNIEWKFHDGMPKGILRDIFQDIIPSHILERKQKVGRPIPFRKWLNGKEGRDHLKEIEKKRELFLDLTKVDFVEYALNHPNPYDRSAWAVLSISKWIDLYGVSV